VITKYLRSLKKSFRPVVLYGSDCDHIAQWPLVLYRSECYHIALWLVIYTLWKKMLEFKASKRKLWNDSIRVNKKWQKINRKKYQFNNTESPLSMIIDKENRTQKARHRWLLERESLSITWTETNLKKKLGTHTSLILSENINRLYLLC